MYLRCVLSFNKNLLIILFYLLFQFEGELVKLLKAKAVLGAPLFNVGSQILAPFVQLGSNLGGLGIKAGKVGLGLLGGKLALKKAGGLALAKAGVGNMTFL